MKLKQFLNFRLAFGLFLGLSILFHNASFAQDTANTDTAAISISADELESDSASSTATEVSAEEVTVEAAKPAASSTPAAVEAVEDNGVPAQVYVNFFFYVLLFLLEIGRASCRERV